MSLNFNAVQTLADASGVREGQVVSRGTTEAGLSLGIDAANGVFRFLVEMPIPEDESQTGVRLGKKDKNGIQNPTSRIFGKVSSQKVYVDDGEGNVMELTAKLQAPIAGATEAGSDDSDE